MTLDSLIDSFVTRFTAKAIAGLKPWQQRIARQILDAFRDVDFDDLLKKLVDEWLSSDRSESLVGYVMKRYPEDRTVRRTQTGRTVALALEPLTILAMIQLAIRILGFFNAQPVGADASSETDGAEVNAAAIESALADDLSASLPPAGSQESNEESHHGSGRKRRGG